MNAVSCQRTLSVSSRAQQAGSRRCSAARIPTRQLSSTRSTVPRQSKGTAWRIRATEADEDKEIEEMKRAAEKGDLWSGDFAGILTGVGGVAAAVAVIAVLAYLVQPMFDYTISSFPGQQR